MATLLHEFEADEAELLWKQVAPGQIIIGYTIGDPTKVDLALLRREHATLPAQLPSILASQGSG